MCPLRLTSKALELDAFLTACPVDQALIVLTASYSFLPADAISSLVFTSIKNRLLYQAWIAYRYPL
jgi:hypothetical protein